MNPVIIPTESLDIPNTPHFDAAVRVLLESWPNSVTLTPATIGIELGLDSRRTFLNAVQVLSDLGLITYETLVIASDIGARAMDVALTARGRSLLRSPRGTGTAG